MPFKLSFDDGIIELADKAWAIERIRENYRCFSKIIDFLQCDINTIIEMIKISPVYNMGHQFNVLGSDATQTDLRFVLGWIGSLFCVDFGTDEHSFCSDELRLNLLNTFTIGFKQYHKHLHAMPALTTAEIGLASMLSLIIKGTPIQILTELGAPYKKYLAE